MLKKWLKNLLDLLFSSGGSGPSSADIELAQAYIRLAEFQLSRFNKSRDIEWQVNIAFWTFIVVLGGALLQYYPFTSEPRPTVIALILILLLLVELNSIHRRWLQMIQHRQNKDRDLSFKFRNEAMKLLREESIPEMPCEHAGSAWTRLARETALVLSAVVYLSILVHAVPKIGSGTVALVDVGAPVTMTGPSEERSETTDGADYLEGLAPLKLSEAEVLLRTV